jgi:hypothetical protein
MDMSRRRAISVGVLLAGYSALLAGLFGLTAKPLIGVLMVLIKGQPGSGAPGE